MRRSRLRLITEDDLSHYCPQCGKQVTPPEMIYLDRDTMSCPHCGDPYAAGVKKPPQPTR